ncbi:MAG: hypothetical protein LBV28_04995, partial [Puniceicoccales bacterium]|nr:hypothetical protein [Puniceicoccales bacterium]
MKNAQNLFSHMRRSALRRSFAIRAAAASAAARPAKRRAPLRSLLTAAAVMGMAAFPTAPMEANIINIAAGGTVSTQLATNRSDTVNLLGDVYWGTVDISPNPGISITINGAGNKIYHNADNNEWFFNIRTGNNAAISLYNVDAIGNGSSGKRSEWGVFYISGTYTGKVNLEGTSFTDFKFGADVGNGAIFSVEDPDSHLIVDGGTQGATYTGNVATGDGAGVAGIYLGSLRFEGKHTFIGNWTENYGGAIMVHGNDSAAANLTFNGATS